MSEVPLPPEHKPINSRASEELHTVLVDGGITTKFFWLEQETGKKCCLVSSREMELTWRDTDPCWRWAPVAGSRFAEVAELMGAYWFDIFVKIDASDLSMNTSYGVYLVFKYSSSKSGLTWPKEALVKSHNRVSKRTVYLEPNSKDGSRTEVQSDPVNVIPLRADGWMEIELGDFLIDTHDKSDICVSLKESHGLILKKGLILEGIELRPKSIVEIAVKEGSRSSEIQSMSSSRPTDRCQIHEDYKDILARAVHPVEYSSMEELYLRLCDSIHIDNGRKIFYIKKRTAKNCYILSAKELRIAWGADPYHWRWTSRPNSRFQYVAELVRIGWFDVSGCINVSALSKRTTYSAYLIFKFGTAREGFSGLQESSVQIAGCELSHPVMLDPPNSKEVQGSRIRVPDKRGDGWMEIQLGNDFFVDEDDGRKVQMSLKESQSFWKKGLIIEGIELRPVDSEYTIS